MKKTFRLNLHRGDWLYQGARFLCDYGVSEYFDIPKKCERVDLAVSDKPMPGAYKIKLVWQSDFLDSIVIYHTKSKGQSLEVVLTNFAYNIRETFGKVDFIYADMYHYE